MVNLVAWHIEWRGDVRFHELDRQSLEVFGQARTEVIKDDNLMAYG